MVFSHDANNIKYKSISILFYTYYQNCEKTGKKYKCIFYFTLLLFPNSSVFISLLVVLLFPIRLKNSCFRDIYPSIFKLLQTKNAKTP